jgi:hypothetical protein
VRLSEPPWGRFIRRSTIKLTRGGSETRLAEGIYISIDAYERIGADTIAEPFWIVTQFLMGGASMLATAQCGYELLIRHPRSLAMTSDTDASRIWG